MKSPFEGIPCSFSPSSPKYSFVSRLDTKKVFVMCSSSISQGQSLPMIPFEVEEATLRVGSSIDIEVIEGVYVNLYG